MQPESNLLRHTVKQLDNGIQIILPSKKNYFLIVWYFLCLLMWLFITGSIIIVVSFVLIGTIGSFFIEGVAISNSSLEFFIAMGIIGFSLIFVLIFQFTLGFSIIYLILWQFTGQEIVFINSSTFSISYQIFRWKKTSEYLLENVKDLRAINQQSFLFVISQDFKKLLGKNGILLLTMV